MTLRDGIWTGKAHFADHWDLLVSLTVEGGKITSHAFGRETQPIKDELMVERDSDVLAFLPVGGRTARVIVEPVNADLMIYKRQDPEHGATAATLKRELRWR